MCGDSVAVLAEVKMGWSWWGENGCGEDSGYGGDRVALVGTEWPQRGYRGCGTVAVVETGKPWWQGLWQGQRGCGGRGTQELYGDTVAVVAEVRMGDNCGDQCHTGWLWWLM